MLDGQRQLSSTSRQFINTKFGILHYGFLRIRINAMSKLESSEKRIREIYPDLATKSASFNQEGLLNDVVICGSVHIGGAKDMKYNS